MTRAPGVTAIVLAGGRSTRFGGHKLAVEIDGRRLIEHAIEAAGAVADVVLVAGAPVPDTLPTSAGPKPIRSVADDEAYAGPLAALSGALRETTTGLAIVVGGDMPCLVPAVLVSMLEQLRSVATIDAVVLTSPAIGPGVQTAEPPRRQVLPLAIDVVLASAAVREALDEGDRSLVRLLDRLRIWEIPATEWLALDPAARTLLDVDRPEDLARIRDELRRTPFGEPR